MTTYLPGQTVTIEIPGPSFDTVVPGQLTLPDAVFSGTPITRTSAYTVLIIDVSGGVSYPAIKLPADSLVGDVYEIYVSDLQTPIYIYAPDGQTFGISPYADGSIPPTSTSVGSFFRKLSDTLWGTRK